jgi:hypothetical protein
VGNTDLWRIVISWGVVLTCGACETNKQVGSACRNGVCAEAITNQAPACLLSTFEGTIAIVGGGALNVCAPASAVHRTGDLVDCSVYWAFDDGVALPSGETLASCQDLPFLDTASSQALTQFSQPHVCLVQQVAAQNGQPVDGADGWYYDDQASHQCPDSGIIRFTGGVAVPEGVSVTFMCTSVRTAGGTAGDPAQCKLPADSAKHASSVGNACLPPLVPEAGFDDRSAYVETGASDCDTGACLVFRLRGDPSNVCASASATTASTATSPACVQAAEVKDRVYCSCRCDAPVGDRGGLCACPRDYSCVSTLSEGPLGIRGSYCVRDGTFTTL